jgi:pimeloyl-ACP methyl ester carboxylesterase
MPQQQPMSDVIVLIPGILGSVLVKDGKEVWGASGSSIARNLITFGRALRALELPQGIGHGDPKDGVTAPCVLPKLYMVPTFWKADGYGRLVTYLKERFTLTAATDDQAGNLLEFPYDWRLSNQLNAQRLSDTVVPVLDRWRQATRNPNAKFIFICHSMGGLVARYFIEVLKGRELTRKLITIGTPYKGSINALEALVNGVPRLGPIGISVDKLVRSFPSVHQLLPNYKCLDVGDGEWHDFYEVAPPSIGTNNLSEALAFHAQIASSVEQIPKYETHAIKGIDQPTNQSALLRNSKIEPRPVSRVKDENGVIKEVDTAGDGTVPRPSSHPPEWNDEGPSVFMSQSHAVLQSTGSILTQIFGRLTGNLGRFMGGTGIGLDIPAIVEAGKTVPVEVVSQDGNSTLALHAICHGEDGQPRGNPKLMRALGDGRYQAKLDDLQEGAYRITVQSATPARPIDPVSDWTLVWNAEAA